VDARQSPSFRAIVAQLSSTEQWERGQELRRRIAKPPPKKRKGNVGGNLQGDGRETRRRRLARGNDEAGGDVGADGWCDDAGVAAPHAQKPSRAATAEARFAESRAADSTAYVTAQPGVAARLDRQAQAAKACLEGEIQRALAQHPCLRFGVTEEALKVVYKSVMVQGLANAFPVKWPVAIECAGGCRCTGATDGSTALNPGQLDLFRANPTYDANGMHCNLFFTVQLLEFCEALLSGRGKLGFGSASTTALVMSTRTPDARHHSTIRGGGRPPLRDALLNLTTLFRSRYATAPEDALFGFGLAPLP